VTFYNLPEELPNLLVAANIGTFPAMFLFVLRLRVGWGFVAGRLRASETYYEADQTGNVAKKDRETLFRDKLLYKNEVAPTLRRVDTSLAAVALASLLSLGGGQALVAVQGDAGPVTLKTLTGDEARRFENRLRGDNDFARAEQERALKRAGKDGEVQPVYCNSRYYKILAGGNGQGGVGCGD
jgi:hypothetical protein